MHVYLDLSFGGAVVTDCTDLTGTDCSRALYQSVICLV